MDAFEKWLTKEIRKEKKEQNTDYLDFIMLQSDLFALEKYRAFKGGEKI